MKTIILVATLMASTSLGFSDDTSGTYTGEIMDKQCAEMQSHDNMMQSEGAHNARECTLSCVKNGGQFALFDQATKKVYSISDAKKAQEYAGQKVQISGTYDSNTGALSIKSITPVH
jgi:hypothetical protein